MHRIPARPFSLAIDLHEAVDRRLHAAVHRLARLALAAGIGRDRHDRAALLRDHVAERGLRAVEHADVVDADDLLPELGRRLGEEHQLIPPDAVHQHVDRSVALVRRRRSSPRPPRASVTSVRTNWASAAPELPCAARRRVASAARRCRRASSAAPSAANASATARPMFEPAPVTTTDRPCSWRSMRDRPYPSCTPYEARPTLRYSRALAPSGGHRPMISMDDLQDITYEVDAGLAWITINRPERYNAFRGRTVDELLRGVQGGVGRPGGRRGRPDRRRRARRSAPAVTRSSAPRPATTARPRPGCSRSRPSTASSATSPSRSSPRSTGSRSAAATCSTSSVTSRSRPTTPGSARPGRVSGRSTPASAPPTSPGSSARSGPGRSGCSAASTTRRRPSAGVSSTPSCRWPSCARPCAAWADEALALSPTALKVLKHSFNAETEHIAGIGAMAFDSLELFVGTDEAARGRHRVQREAAAGLLAVPLNAGRRAGLSPRSQMRGSRRGAADH